MAVQNPSSNNEFMLVPEMALYNILSTAVKFIRSDYEKQITDTGNEENSYLFYLCSLINLQRVNVFNEAKEIFLINDPDNPKRININLGWPQTIKEATNVTIIHPGEQYASVNALGVDESPEIFEEYVFAEGETGETNAWRNSYGRRYNTTYRIIITGDNTNEIMIAYNIFKSILISFDGTGHLNYMGFQNVKISGQDMEIKSELTKLKWAKALNIQFEYEFRVPDTNRLNYWNGLIFKGILLEK